MDPDAERSFRSFVEARSPALLRTAYLLTSDQHRAEDLVQLALAKAALRWRSLERNGNVHAYVRKIIYTEHVGRWRRARRGVAEVPPSGSAEPVDPATRHEHETELRLMVRTALIRLTPRQRAVLVLRYFEDLSETSAAEVLGISVGAVRSQSHQALARLRALVPELTSLSVPGEERT